MHGDYQPSRLDYVDWFQTLEHKPKAKTKGESQSTSCRIKGKPRPCLGTKNPADARTPTEVSNSIWAT